MRPECTAECDVRDKYHQEKKRALRRVESLQKLIETGTVARPGDCMFLDVDVIRRSGHVADWPQLNRDIRKLHDITGVHFVLADGVHAECPPCETRDMLDAAVEALVPGTAGLCPFLPAGSLHDGLHVDVDDPECYARVGLDTGHATREDCRACIREALEELAIARREAKQV